MNHHQHRTKHLIQTFLLLAVTLLGATTGLLTTSCMSSSTANASPIETPPWSWRKGSFGLSNTTEYFWTQANFDTSRTEFSRLPGSNRLSDIKTWTRGRYAFWSRFSLFGGFGYGQTRSVDAVAEKSNGGFTQAYFGGHFTVWRQWLLMVAELEAGMPLDAGGPFVTLKSNQTNTLIDDGVYYTRALLHVRKNISFLNLFGYAGIQVPTGGLAKRFLYGAFLEVPLGPMLRIGGGVDGYETLLLDELSLAERNAMATSANAGSFRYRAYNPALLQARGWMGFKPGKTVEIRAGYATSLLGIRDAQGQTLTLNVVFESTPKRAVRFEPSTTIPNTNMTEPNTNLNETEQLLEKN